MEECSMSIKLIVFDMDGTLMRDNKTISERTHKALAAAAERGIYLVPATGRTYEGLPEEIRTLPFIRYVIAANGAVVYDALTNTVLHKAEMNREDSARMLKYMKSLPAVITCYQNGKGWMDLNGRGPLEAYAPCPEQIPFMRKVFHFIDNIQDEIFQYGESTQKLQVFFEDSQRRDVYLKEMKDKFPEYAVSYALVNNIEVNAPDANKGSALRWLCGFLGIAREECMAFGDGTNDITMIQEAGTGVAMANAEKEVLEIADVVTSSNDADGVAIMIEKLWI